MSKPAIVMVNQYGWLKPYDHMAATALQDIPQETPVLVTVKRPRNLDHHRKFWALINVIFDNQSVFNSKDELVAALKVYVGHCNTLVRERNGEQEIIKIPRSIAFDRMDQTEFGEFYDRVLDVVAREIWPGISVRSVKDEVAAFL